MDVAVRELKAHLSAYLRRVRAGEIITVTHRGRPVAVLGPIPDHIDLEEGVEAGWITPASRTGLGPVTRHRADQPSQQALDEDRSP